MYQSYYGMSCNPFLKEIDTINPFESNDYKELLSRFRYLTEIRGIGVFTGSPGLGKTYSLRCYANSLNVDLYKVVYISATKDMTIFDFFKEIGNAFNIDVGSCYKTEMYHNIQREIVLLVEQERRLPVIMIDDAQNLSRDIIHQLKVLYEYEMDSKDYITLILVGKSELKTELSKTIYDYLKQRIVVNYKLNGLTREEVKEYINSRLKLANVDHEIFTEDALNALYSCSKSSPRRLNTLILNCLLLGFQKNMPIIDSEIVMYAKGEMDLE